MSALPVGELIHSLPRRMRIRVAEQKGNAEYFQKLQQVMSAVPLVGEVRTSPVTATVVLEGIRIRPDELGAVARERRWFELREASPSDDTPDDWIDRLVQSRDMQRTVAGTLLALAIVQTGRGIFLPPAATLAWYALEALRGDTRG